MSAPRDAISLYVFIDGAGKTARCMTFGATDEGALKARCADSTILRRLVSYGPGDRLNDYLYAGYQVQRCYSARPAYGDGACLFRPKESGGPRHFVHGPRAVDLRRGLYISRPQKSLLNCVSAYVQARV